MEGAIGREREATVFISNLCQIRELTVDAFIVIPCVDLIEKKGKGRITVKPT